MKEIKLLIVEDETIVALNLRMQLRKNNINVLPPVGGAEQALALSKVERPDVILMDIGLTSKMNGIEAAKEILRVYSPLIIFTTGYLDEKVSNEIKSLNGCILYKPFNENDIIEKIREKLLELG
jgi:DNA-binding NarL/FixJ family response regulator